MNVRKLILAAAALGLTAAPAVAETIRDAAPVTNASELRGNSGVFYTLGAAAIIAAIVLAASGGNDDPISG